MIDTTAGTPIDSPAADSTSSWSMIALLKGILAKAIAGIVSIGPATSGAAVSGNPVLTGGSDGTNARTMLTDALGNQVVTGKGLAITGSGAALNATPIAATDVGDMRCVAIHFTGTFVATNTFEQSNDNVNWLSTPLSTSFGGAPVPSTTNSATAQVYAGQLTCRYFRVRVSAYTSGSVAAAAWFSAIPPAPPIQQVQIVQAGSIPGIVTIGDNVGPQAGLSAAAYQLVFDPYSGGYIRQRCNHELVVLSSAARTVATDSADIHNYNASKVKFVIDVTAISGAGSLVFTIKGKSFTSNKYFTLLASAAITAIGTTVLTIFPGALAAANLTANDIVPRLFRVEVAVATADSMTYSVDAQFVN
jgi:hypothetical protein